MPESSQIGLNRQPAWWLRVRARIRRRETLERLAGSGITAVLVLLMYVLAAWSRVSTEDYTARLLTFTSIAQPPPPGPSAPVASESVAPAPEPAGATPVRETISLDPDRLILPERLELSVAPSQRGAERLELNRPEARSVEVSAARSDVGPTPRRRLAVRTSPGARLDSQVRTSPRSLPEPAPPLRMPERHEPEKRTENTLSPVIERKVEEAAESGVLANSEMIEWVRRHPAVLPDVVRLHMDFREGDWTAYAEHSSGGRTLELYLLVRRGVDQLHVLLVDGSDTYFFIDPGLTRQPTRLRVGQGRRKDGVVTFIASRETPPTSPDARVFFEAFLRWWTSIES